MDNLNGKDFLKTLKSLDIETGTIKSESLDWLFDKKDTSDVLTWMCKYINENNVEKCSEIQKYTTLVTKGENESQEYIDEVFESNSVLQNICNINTSEISSIKKEIENANRKSDYLAKLTNKYLSLEGKLNRNIEDEDINLRIKRKSCLSDCMEAGTQVDKFHAGTYGMEEQFYNILSNYNMMEEKYFVSQMPLHIYEQHFEILQTSLNLWIRKMFEVPNFNYSEEDINNIDQELNRLCFMIKECTIKNIQTECNREELATKLNCFRNFTYSEVSQEQIRIQEIQYISRGNMLHEDLQTLYANSLQQAADKFAENLINTVLIKNAENKLNVCTHMVTVLKNLNNEIIQALAQYHLLFLLLKIDKMKLRDIDKFLDDLDNYSTSYLTSNAIRSQLMDEIENNVAKNEFPFEEIISILTKQYTDISDIDMPTAISNVQKQRVAVENLEKNVFVIRNQKYLQEMKHIEQSITEMKKYIWCGPTLQPVIIPFDYLDNLNLSNCQLEKVKKILKTSLDNFNRTVQISKKNIWLTNRRLLWSWFLMKPEKIPRMVEQLKIAVSEKARANA